MCDRRCGMYLYVRDHVTAGKRFSFLKVDMEKKAIIAKYAAEIGIVAALGYFAKDYRMVH